MRDGSDDLSKRIQPDEDNICRVRGIRLESVGIVCLTVLLIASVSIGFVAVSSEEVSADFSSGTVTLDAYVADNTFTPGQAAELTVQVANDGAVGDGSVPETIETTTAARNVRVEIDENRAPIRVNTGEQAVGTIRPAEPRDVPIAIEVPDDAEPGEYEIDIELQYRQTSQIYPRSGTRNDRTRSITRSVDIVIDDAPRFELRDAGTAAQVGDSGAITAEIENIGGERAENLAVELSSTSQRVGFGESASESASLSSLDPGETATIEYDLAFDSQASLREYPLEATVTFEDTDGILGTDEQPRLDVTPMSRQTFEIEDVESTLRVGESGDLIGSVTNTGPVTAQSVVVQFAHESANIVPIDDEVAVGSLEPGESQSFRLPIDTTRDAEAIAKSVNLGVQYRNHDNELRQYDDVDAFVDIDERRDQFLVEFEDRQVAAGESKLVDVEVTNNLDQSVTDVEARLFADDPLDSDDDEAYVESLAPGESTVMTFELNAQSTATAKTYPASFDFRYDDERGNSQLSDTTRVAVSVTEAEEGLPWVLIGVVALIGIGAFAYWYRRD